MSIIFAASPFFISLSGIVPVRLFFSKDARTLPLEMRQNLEAKVAALAKKLGITKQIELIEVTDLEGGARVEGNAFFPGRAGVLINPALFAVLSEGEQESVLAHELVHIASNDLIYLGLLGGVVSLVVTVALKFFFLGTSFIAPAVGIISSLVAIVLSSRYREKRADAEGFIACSDEGRRAATSLFDSARQERVKQRNDPDASSCTRFWRQLTISEEGDNRLDLFHPSLTDRVAHVSELQRIYFTSV